MTMKPTKFHNIIRRGGKPKHAIREQKFYSAIQNKLNKRKLSTLGCSLGMTNKTLIQSFTIVQHNEENCRL